MKRRIFGVLLTVVLAISSLVGCSNSNSESAAQPEASTKVDTQMEGQETDDSALTSTGKVEFWNDKLSGTDQSALDKLAQSATNVSGVNVEFISYTDVASMKTALQQSVNSSDAPGLFTWWSGTNLKSLVDEGVLEDLTDVWAEYIIPNGVPENVADSLTFDGKIYAAPYSIIYQTIVYNKDVFDEYGLEEPKTFEEFENLCQTLVDNGVTPMGVDAGRGAYKWFESLVAAYDPQLYQDLCDNKVKYTDDRIVEVMKKYKEMYEKGFFAVPMEQDDLNRAEATGEIAMQKMADYEAVNLRENYGLENIGTFVMPTVNPDVKRTIFMEVAPICVAKNSADKGAALEVLKTWYSVEHQTVFNEVTNFNCSSNVVNEDPCASEMIALAMDSESHNLFLRYWENEDNLDIRDAACDQLMKFELGNATIEEALNTIQAKADEVLGTGYAD